MLRQQDSIESFDSSGANTAALRDSAAQMMPSVWKKGSTRLGTHGNESTEQFTTHQQSLDSVNVGLPNERDQDSYKDGSYNASQRIPTREIKKRLALRQMKQQN